MDVDGGSAGKTIFNFTPSQLGLAESAVGYTE